MNVKILPVIFLLSLTVGTTLAQTGSVTGVVRDSATGQPVAQLTVFIPNTTLGTTTDENGFYHLDNINPGDYILMFRHLSYSSISRPITIESGSKINLDTVVADKPRSLAEVVVVGRVPDRRLAYHLFKQYFLGDESEFKCRLENPSVLSFHFEGNTLKATAKEPLIITNRYLGYRITFFLDYFQCIGDWRHQSSNGFDGDFGYSGYALFEDLSEVEPLKALGWKITRNGEFRGSFRDFLQCLYRNELNANHYSVRRAYHGSTELQASRKLSNAMTRIRMIQMDSISRWNPLTGKQEVIFYDAGEEYLFSGEEISQGPQPAEKTLSAENLLMIFRDFKKTKEVSDDYVTTLRIPRGGITFDSEGNFRTKGGGIQWVNLDNTMQVKRLLPDNYGSKTKETNR